MPNEQSTFTGWASVLIFPQDTASSGLAPESEPSNSWPVFTNTAWSAPFLWKKMESRQLLILRTDEQLIVLHQGSGS